ncbi:MAG: hypothetical protein ABWZ26_03370 [Candidatus Nanopelagicales bacterium]
MIASAQGDHAASTALLREAVRLRFELGDVAGLSECFVHLAVNLAVQHRPDDAIVLLTAARERRAECGTEPSADEIAAADRAMAIIRRSAPSQRQVGAPPSVSVDEAVDLVRSL